jgi:putative flippase GtrA
LDIASLLSACTIAMVAVFVLLGFLAVLIELITRLFPDRQLPVDPAVAAAISSAVATIFPGAHVTRIEED